MNLLAIVTATFPSPFVNKVETVHIYAEEFTKYGKPVPTTKQEIFEYIGKLNPVNPQIVYAPNLK